MDKKIQFVVPVHYQSSATFKTGSDADLFNYKRDTIAFADGSVSIDYSFDDDLDAHYLLTSGRVGIGTEATNISCSSLGCTSTGSEGDDDLYKIMGASSTGSYNLTFGALDSLDLAVVSDTFIVPRFDQNYSINYSFVNHPYKNTNFLGRLFPYYPVARDSEFVCIENHSYSWTMLNESEKDVFNNFINAFNNSWQPFSLCKWNSGTLESVEHFIIDSPVEISKDKYELYSVTLNLKKLN